MPNEKVLSSDIILYNSAEGQVKVECLIREENLWLTQKRMAELFGCSTDNISLHLKNILPKIKNDILIRAV